MSQVKDCHFTEIRYYQIISVQFSFPSMSFFNKLLIVITDKMEVYIIVFLLSALVKVLFFPA